MKDVVDAFPKEYAKGELKEVSKFKFDQMRYDPTSESFTDFLSKFKKTAKQAFGEKANETAETFLFAKLPVQLQNDLAGAGKQDASNEDIKVFVQRRCQYAQLMLNNSTMQPVNQINQPVEPKPIPPYHKQTESNHNPIQNKETKKRFDGNCHHYQIYGHKWAEYRKRLREKPSSKDNRDQLRQTTENRHNKPKYIFRDVCPICGQTGHTVRECRYRIPGQSAYRSVPYNEQITSEKKELRRDSRQAQNHQRQMKEVIMEPQNASEEEE